MDAAEAQRLFATARLAHLATADAHGRPHVVPVVFAVDGDTVYSAVDAKPKRTTALKRLANVRANPAVAMLVDHYDEDWSRLWWVRADGTGRVLTPEAAESRRAVTLLTARYSQYAGRTPTGAVLAVDVDRWTGWSARGPDAASALK